MRSLVGALILIALAANPARASADPSVWRIINSGTTQAITSIEYQTSERFWFTTAHAIYKRSGSTFTPELIATGYGINSIEFNPSGTVGIATASNGVFWRYAGGTWTQQPLLKTYQTSIYGNCSSSPEGGPYPRTRDITDGLRGARWINDSTVFVFSSRQGSLMRSDNGGVNWFEVNARPDSTCRLRDVVVDAAIYALDPKYQVFVGASLGFSLTETYFTTDGLVTNAQDRGSGCGPRLVMSPADPLKQYMGGCSSYGFKYSDGVSTYSPEVHDPQGGSFPSVPSMNDFDVSGETTLGAAGGGYILTSSGYRDAYVKRAPGAAATVDWLAVDLATPQKGAVGGKDGVLVLSDTVDGPPDEIAPTGTMEIAEPVVAGTPVALTVVNVSDTGGSGIDESAFIWTDDGAEIGRGRSYTHTFTIPGNRPIGVTVADNAGNFIRLSKDVHVSVGSGEQKPTVTPEPPRPIDPVGTAPDSAKPSGKISGPETAIAGQPVTFTADVSDTGGAGVDLGGFAWKTTYGASFTGRSVRLTFPAAGTYGLELAFRDLAGNVASASATVPVAPKPEDRAEAVPPANQPKPVVKRGGGGRFSVPVKGRFKLPPKLDPKLACTGEVTFNVTKNARVLTTRKVDLDSKCRYRKTITLAKSKVGTAKVLRLVIRFNGNGWLGPSKRTYDLKVPSS